mgnify:CR=1 FL=1
MVIKNSSLKKDKEKWSFTEASLEAEIKTLSNEATGKQVNLAWLSLAASSEQQANQKLSRKEIKHQDQMSVM